jgi:protein-S-isoprenylcysteine O-methyltransferase Ste14
MRNLEVNRLDQTQTARTRRLTGKGFFKAFTPCLGAFMQTLVFACVFRSIPSARAIAYLAVISAGAFFSGLFVAVCLPELANRRTDKSQLQPSDHYWRSGCLVLYLLVLPAIAALELSSWRGANFGDHWFLTGSMVFAVGFFLLHWAMLHNRHWNLPLASISTHADEVADTGPYRFLRHPGYLALAMCSIATSLMLGSAMSLFPALGLVLLVVYRTGEEDDHLQESLQSYPAYAEKVKYRLFPGLW